MELVSYSALKMGSERAELGELAPALKAAASKDEAKGMSFKELMNGMVTEVDRLQKDSDQAISDVISGKRSDLHNVAIKMDEASVAFDLLLQIRNKMVEGFKEIQRVQA